LGVWTKEAVGGIVVVAFIVGSIWAMLTLMHSQPLDQVATPTQICIEEIQAVAALFLISIIVMQPVKDALDRNTWAVSRLLRMKVELRGSVRAVALAAFVGGSLAFAFWAGADVLGFLHNGTSYFFSTHPILHLIYDDTIGLIPYLNARDVGTQASLSFGIASLGLITFRLNRGVGKALKDAVTLFAAPCLVIFELALWNYSPEDMSWHVTDFLWMGGVADGGNRLLDYVQTYPFSTLRGAYLFSNWIVLFVAAFLIATRIPWLSLPSRLLWERKKAEP
jgi:ABC-type amino acid transport system permease subunit